MGLDVYLTVEGVTVSHPEKICVREGGQTRVMTRAEWDERFPDREPVTIPSAIDPYMFEANITHNLSRMASEAGIYECLWRPEEIGIEKAEQLIEPLRAGLKLLESNPDRFKKFNPENGWGDYEGLVSFVRDYLVACEIYPNAKVSASR